MTIDTVPPAKQEVGPGVTTALGKVEAAQTSGNFFVLVMASLAIHHEKVKIGTQRIAIS